MPLLSRIGPAGFGIQRSNHRAFAVLPHKLVSYKLKIPVILKSDQELKFVSIGVSILKLIINSSKILIEVMFVDSYNHIFS